MILIWSARPDVSPPGRDFKLNLALPCPASPCPATPRLAEPRPALPRRAQLYLGSATLSFNGGSVPRSTTRAIGGGRGFRFFAVGRELRKRASDTLSPPDGWASARVQIWDATMIRLAIEIVAAVLVGLVLVTAVMALGAMLVHTFG